MTIATLSWANRLKSLCHTPQKFKNILFKKVWLRPNGNNLEEMLWLIEKYRQNNCDYLEFMIHSSELMPGGSPTFTTNASIEKLYRHLDILFEKIGNCYEGVSLKEYAKKKSVVLKDE